MEDAIKKVNEWIERDNPTVMLDLSGLDLTELPSIPGNCQILNCSWNNLRSLPPLPNCRVLFCWNNELISFPALPKCGKLYCQYNQLTRLPSLPRCRVLNFRPTGPKLSHWPLHLRNSYLHISKKLARQIWLAETPNYNMCAAIIQRNYRRRYLRKKYLVLVGDYLFKGPAKIVCLYAT